MPNQVNDCLTVSVETAAKILGISRNLCYQMVREYRIPALRFGRVIRVPRHALELLLANPKADMNLEQLSDELQSKQC